MTETRAYLYWHRCYVAVIRRHTREYVGAIQTPLSADHFEVLDGLVEMREIHQWSQL